MKNTIRVLVLGSLAVAACGQPEAIEPAAPSEAVAEGSTLLVASLSRPALLEATGTAEPWAEATVSTRLMGSVIEVAVREGDRVHQGQVLVRIDARDLEAKGTQVAAGLAEAEAHRALALSQAERMRALFADEAAPRAQLDAAEAALAAAEARVRAGQAAAAELESVRSYASVRAPFDGLVTARMVDPGAFAAPGAPLVTVQDDSRLRLSVRAAPAAVRGVARGDTIRGAVEGVAAVARVEGVVPAPGGNLYTVNATVENHDRRFLAGSAATLALPGGQRLSILVPLSAIVREGDLTGVRVVGSAGPELRWIRLGSTGADSAEVLAGLRDGERIVVSRIVGAER